MIAGVEGWLGEHPNRSRLTPAKPLWVNKAEVTPLFGGPLGLERAGFRVEQGSSAAVFASNPYPWDGVPQVVEDAQGADLPVYEAYAPDDDAEQAHTLWHSPPSRGGGRLR